MPPCHGGGRGFESRPVRKTPKQFGVFCCMNFYVYILQSEVDGTYYKGFTTEPLKRLQQHNAGETSSTKSLRPWKLVFVEQMESKAIAMQREKNLKKYSRERLEVLIGSPKNIMDQFG